MLFSITFTRSQQQHFIKNIVNQKRFTSFSFLWKNGKIPKPQPKLSSSPPIYHNTYTINDEFSWMQQRSKELDKYLSDETKYLEWWEGKQKIGISNFVKELKDRIPQTQNTISEKNKNYIYYSKRKEHSDGWVICRKKVNNKNEIIEDEEIIMDPDIESAGFNYFNLGSCSVSDDEKFALLTVELHGNDEFELRVKCLKTKKTIDKVEGIFFAQWCSDGSIIYAKFDQRHKPNKVYRHVVGDDQSKDQLLFEEFDPSSIVYVSRTKDGMFGVISSISRSSTETRLIRGNDPTAKPIIVQSRQKNISYTIEHSQGFLYKMTDEDNSPDFKVLRAEFKGNDNLEWTEFVPEEKGARIESYDFFEEYVVVQKRKLCIPLIQVINISNKESHFINIGSQPFSFENGANQDYYSKTYRFSMSSVVRSNEVYDYNFEKRTLTLVHKDKIFGAPIFYPSQFIWKQEFSESKDGTKVPISIAHHAECELNSKNPTLIMGYGAYGTPTSVSFDSNLLSLLQRKWIISFAHVRGGGDNGTNWYKSATKSGKHLSIDDFISCVELLHKLNYTSPQYTCAMGGSAGALLVGSASTQRPELFSGIILKAPFLDMINSMMDTNHPLTNFEFDEWGNPIEEKKIFEAMLEYCPYHHLSKMTNTDIPNYLLSCAIDDPRVPSWHAIKFVSRLRRILANTNNHNKTILLRLLDGGGHYVGGQYGNLSENAIFYQFLSKCVE